MYILHSLYAHHWIRFYIFQKIIPKIAILNRFFVFVLIMEIKNVQNLFSPYTEIPRM